MDYGVLGKTGLRVSILGFGCGNVGGLMIRGESGDRVHAVARAIEAGINYFDTAPLYGDGQSERNLGQVLNELGAAVYVGTKVRLAPTELKEEEMKFGLMHDFRNPAPWFRPYSELYQLLLDQCVRAEELGYNNIWLTEHHFSGDYNPAPLHAATAIAARTGRIRIGTFVLLLPFYHPVRVAEDVAFVDNLSNGRFDLGVGQGYRVDEFSGFCIPRKERSARLTEGLDLIRRLWTEDKVTFEGKFTRIKDVHIQPEPLQKPHPPIWIGARTEKAMERAAREGYHLHLTLGPDWAPLYYELLKKHGRNPADFYTSQLHFVYIAPTADEAWEDIQEQAHWMMQVYDSWFKTSGDVPGDERLWEIKEAKDIRHSPYAQTWMVGTPDQVARKVEAFTKTSSCTHFVMGMQIPGVDPAKGTRSMELFAKEIMPAFR